MKLAEHSSFEHGHGRSFQDFQNLMRWRIRDVLLVSSLYDAHLFEEDGRLYELIRNEYSDLNLSHSPELTRVSSGQEAISMITAEKRFELIISTMHIEDMHPLLFAKTIRDAGITIPLVLLAFDNRELSDMLAHYDTSVFDGVFIWQGDFRLIIAIVKHLEDRINVLHDSDAVGVQSIILVEDDIRFYSSFLPLIYTEILKQSQRLISEGVNLSHRFLRMRARPKILLCTNYEEAKNYFDRFRENILGVVSDVDFPRNGKPEPEAGIQFALDVRAQLSDIPVLLQSHNVGYKEKALATGASFILKNSPLLLHEVRMFMNRYLGFGDFIFQTPDGEEVGRAHDLKSLEDQLHVVSDECLLYHGKHNHFSRWLKARTEFWLAHQLRPRKVSDFSSTNALRETLISSLQTYRRMLREGLITDFGIESFDPSSSFARVGSGSLGGKARGLGFLRMLTNQYEVGDRFEDVHIAIPPGIVLGTDVFDRFLDINDLRGFALSSADDEEITKKFLGAKKFPVPIRTALGQFLDLVQEPLAVRSSSLLEDSQYQPFAGVYETYMIPNNDSDRAVRLRELIQTIKRVYASTFYRRAKDYIKVTSYRLEEEKMAVIIQKMVGSRHENRFYPDFAGVAKSHDFYPVLPASPSDGTVSIALGLGKMVVEGGPSVRFCPKYPGHVQQLSTTKDALANNQHEFFALDMNVHPKNQFQSQDECTRAFPLSVAEEDGTLAYVGSTYSPENEAISDGISRPGIRLVTFAPILKNEMLPLPEIFNHLLNLTGAGMGIPVEIEFAVDVHVPHGQPVEFGLLQMRPLVISREFEELRLEKIDPEKILCDSPQVLGNGVIENLCDIVVVDNIRFDRSKTQAIASEVGQFNAGLLAEKKPYLLIGVGRWGTLDPWLGIPVRWDQISGARAIVETGFEEFAVTPSQGSHFFQNLTAFMVGYFTVNPAHQQGFLDWDWLARQKAVEEKVFTRHLRLQRPIVIRMNGYKNRGVILKPEEAGE